MRQLKQSGNRISQSGFDWVGESCLTLLSQPLLVKEHHETIAVAVPVHRVNGGR